MTRNRRLSQDHTQLLLTHDTSHWTGNMLFQPYTPGANTPTHPLIEVDEPVLYRDQFPYSTVPRVLFDGQVVRPEPAPEIWITDTTFRDGQQARPPYLPDQIVRLYELLHRLGGTKGLIRQSEFFLYSARDREAVEKCQALGYRYPEVTGWIRANAADFKLVKTLGLRETGILTSVSDYHIFLKLKTTRKAVLDDYLGIVKAALDEGVVPRCHFEDVTRADIYGFCLPFAGELLKLARASGLPVKIRLCDTMGYGVTYPGAVLPRSVPRLAHAFRHEVGYPSEWLEWHGHNDFHQVHVNGCTAWLHGVAALNASLLGFGERTGNPPLEAAVLEYLALTGADSGVDTTVITEIADYFRDVVKADVPSNYPFVGSEFNTTRAGIHADGMLKNPEIYNIFDTERILNRPVKVMVTDKSGVAGIAQWLNDYARTARCGLGEPISKRHPGIRRIHAWIMEEYANGRITSISPEEMIAQAKRHVPSMFESDFQRVKAAAIAEANKLAERFLQSPDVRSLNPARMEPRIERFLRDEPFLQLVTVTDPDGQRISEVHTQRGEKALFRELLNADFGERVWLQEVIATGELYCSDLFVSRFTDKLTLTIAHPIKDRRGRVVAVVDFDFRFDELVKLLNNLPVDVVGAGPSDAAT